ncbi:MAG: M48 family metallopeptidase [Solirubrobacteraceae bacterium]|nr:M48 family metallopeptidase [Solirubrobacteraceae bacterium]
MERTRLRWGAAIVGAVVIAELAVLLLRPRSGVIEPAPVRTESYFSAAEIERARDYRRPQVAIYGGVLVVELGLLALLVARPPARLRGPFRRPVLAGAAAGAALSIAVSMAILPLQIVSRERAKDVGLVTQSWGGYARDKSISWGIGAVFAGLGAATAVGLIRRYPRGWWVPGSAIVVAFGVVTIYAGPVVLDPLFNKFQALPAGQTRNDVLELADRAGVDIGEVYSVDASRRSTAANAYVAGLGRTKRVVLYDTLLDNFERDEVRLVVAHELAHQHHDDVPHGLLYVAIVAPFGLLAVAQLTRRLAPAGAEPGPAILPALALSLFVMTTTITTISNQLSRQVEARADSYALTLTGEPEPFIGFEKRIALRNLSDPDPPGWQTALLATHPPAIERIGIGVAYERERERR